MSGTLGAYGKSMKQGFVQAQWFYGSLRTQLAAMKVTKSGVARAQGLGLLPRLWSAIQPSGIAERVKVL
jgi:hypothetical protein